MKQALHSSGANRTDQHIIDVSMCALFLLEAAKKCDAVFGVPTQSTAHTVRESKADIKKMQQQLLEKKVTSEDLNRTGTRFVDPTVSGLDTLTKGEWLKKQLHSIPENLHSDQQSRDELDNIDYELSDVC